MHRALRRAQIAAAGKFLTGIADAWFAALVAHDPSKAPIANSARFTEQTQVKTIGEGLWKPRVMSDIFNSKNGWSDFLR